MPRVVEPTDYLFKTQPYDHQYRCFLSSRDEENWAELMEQGTGKSKPCVDTAAYLYANGRINALLVTAPNGVHRNWIVNEVTAHLPDYIPYRAAWWSASPLKRERQAMERLWETDTSELRILAMNVEAFATKRGVDYAKQFLRAFDVLWAVDESTTIKTPGAARTKSILNLSKLAKYRRILNGLPITRSPLDLYAQFCFLDPDILGHSSYYTFRNRYAVLETKTNWKAGKDYKLVVGYQHLDELFERVQRYSTIVKKKDCLDLPERTFVPRFVPLHKEQERVYKLVCQKADETLRGQTGLSLEEILDLIVKDETNTSELKLKSPNKLVELLRMQQVLGGFFEDVEDNVVELVPPEQNPRIQETLRILEGTDHKGIVWCRFQPELRAVAKALREVYGAEAVVEYHGGVPQSRKDENADRFVHDPKARFMVAQPHAGKYGFTWNGADTVVIYSTDFSLDAYLQMVDRCHRIGQDKKVTYYHLRAIIHPELPDIDQKLLLSLDTKKRYGELLTGVDPNSVDFKKLAA